MLPPNRLGDLKRGVALILAALALATAACIIVRWRGDYATLPVAESPTPAFFLSLGTHMPGWMRIASWLATGTVMVALGVLCFALLRLRDTAEASLHLGCACGALAGSGAVFCLVMPWRLVPEGPILVLLHLGAVFAFVWALLEGLAFGCTFPRPVDAEAVLQFVVRENKSKRGRMPAKLRNVFESFPGLNRRLASWEQGGLRWFLATARAKWTLPVLGLLLVTPSLVAWGLSWADRRTVRITILTEGMLMLLLSAAAFLFVLLAFTWTSRTGAPDERRKIFWLYWGAVTALWLVGLVNQAAIWWAFSRSDEGAYFLFMGNFTLGFPAAVLIGVLSLSLAVFYEGVIDPRLAITRTTVIGMFGLALPPLVLAGERLLEHTVMARLPLPEHAALWASLGLTVLLFRPVSHRVEHWMGDRLDKWLPASALAGAERIECVIGFADLTGYIALSAQDQNAALTHASAFHKAARGAVTAHGGRLVKTLGDAALWESTKAAGSKDVCRALMREYAENAATEKLSPLPLHFGLHYGEVVRSKDGDVFGNTVNIASRLLGQAQPGEIVASAALLKAMAGQKIAVEPLGERRLKNVPEPILCFKICTE